jgi:hypothetical protein
MFTNRLFHLFIVFAILVLTACAPKVESTPVASPTLEKHSTEVPSATSLPVAMATNTLMPVPIVVNDAAMGRLRLTNFVSGSAATDMYVDGQIARLGDRQIELTRVPTGFISGYLYLQPGTHSVVVTPAGKDPSSAMITLDLTIEAGHRYTVAAIGQKEEVRPLVIDETVEVQKVRTSTSQTINFVINNISGTKTLDFDTLRGGPNGVPYGSFGLAALDPENVSGLFAITVNGDSNALLEGPHGDDPGNAGVEPGLDQLIAFFGSYPGTLEENIIPTNDESISDLNALEFLQAHSNSGYEYSGHVIKFDTFLAAVKAAGLTDLLTTGTYLLFAPTDEAFLALPSAQLDALMADPEVLANYLSNYFV